MRGTFCEKQSILKNEFIFITYILIHRHTYTIQHTPITYANSNENIKSSKLWFFFSCFTEYGGGEDDSCASYLARLGIRFNAMCGHEINGNR